MFICRDTPLTQRILWYLDALKEPWDYLMLAKVLHRDEEQVRLACGYLAKDGRLVRVKRGQYAITKRGIAASKGGSL